MIKYIIIGILSITFTLSVSAQKQNIFKNLTWEQAVEQAEKEGKIILVDAMRAPRTPQDGKKKEQEEQTLFKTEGLADFLNKNVIAIHINMGSEAGAAFAPKLVMNMYPTYGFFMPNGDILNVVSPFLLTKNPELLRYTAEKALEKAAVKRNNKRSITFQEMSLEEAMKQAKKDNKLIFVDAYTDYCQPCVLMVKNVFSLDKVADFYNQNFINLKIHFGKEKELAEKYGTSGYPSFLFINGDGKLVHMAGGYTEGDKFVNYGEEALKKAKGIEFTDGTWNQVLEKAQKENKLIFMDCYTSWCGPCKIMAKDVFTDPEVAALFNEKFVNVKVDMEKGEGIDLKKRYDVHAYPTLNFIDAEGNIVHTVVGSMEAKEFIQQAELALSGKGLAFMKADYGKGNRQPAFIREFLEVLSMAGESQYAEKVCLDYFESLDKSKLKEKEYWNLFVQYVQDVDSEIFQYVYANRDEFSKLFGEKEVGRKLLSVWAMGANQFVKNDGDKNVLDKKGFKKYVNRMKKANVEGREGIVANACMSNADKTGDWKTYISLGDEQLKNGKVSDLVLYNWGLRVSQRCKDNALRLQAAKWFDDAVAESDKAEAEGKNAVAFKTYFEKMSKDLKKAAE